MSSAAPPLPLGPPPSYSADSVHGLRPYLQLPHLLSLTWLAYPILSLVFVALRIQSSLGSSQDAIASAKQNLVASCLASEKAATSAASMPRYLAQATNEQYAAAVNASMRAAGASLIFTLTVMQGIINFLIDLYRSTFLCFLELLIRGGLSVMISAVEEVSEFIESTLGGLRTTIQGEISSANSFIQDAVDGFNRINPFGDVQIPEFDIPSLSGLENVQIPTDFQDSLRRLNETLPSFTDLKEALQDIIDRPFDLVKGEINSTFSNMTMDPSGMPVPPAGAVTFCQDLDTGIVDDLGSDLIKFARIGIVIIVALIVLLILANCALVWYKWRCQMAHLQYTREAWLTDPTMQHASTGEKNLSATPQITMSDHNLLILEANMSSPLITRILNVLSSKLHLTPTQHCNLQWFLNYISHPPAIAIFLIGFVGLLAIQLQLLALGPLEAKFAEKSQASTAEFSNTIASSINNSMFQQSAAYAAEVNLQAEAMQASINEGMFGWVTETTTTLNTTLNEFYTNIQNTVELVFGDTILAQPAQEFIRCLIGSKVDALGNALTFLNENLQVDVPRMNDSALILSQESVDEVSRPVALAAIGDGGNGEEGGGLTGKIINAYADTLRRERFTFLLFMGIWGIVVVMGLCIVAWHSYGAPAIEARKKRRWQREQGNLQNLIVPYRVGQNSDDRDLEGPGGNMRSFTPLPAPKAPSPPPPMEEQPRKASKLVAIGRKAMGREQFVGDREARVDVSVHSSNTGESHLGLWSRAVRAFGRKEVDQDDALPQASALRPAQEPRRMPPPFINVQRASDSTGAPQPSSGWSPDEEQHPQRLSFPWAKRPISLSRNSTGLTPGMAGVGSGHKPAPTPLAIPLHSTHESTLVPPLHPSRAPIRFPPPPSSFTPLAPPPDRRRKNSAASSTDERIAGQLFVVNDNGSIISSDDGSADMHTSTTPLTSLLTTTPARKSSSVNPFATPFDHEHAVPKPGPATTERYFHSGPTGAGLRKSLRTNPFVTQPGAAF